MADKRILYFDARQVTACLWKGGKLEAEGVRFVTTRRSRAVVTLRSRDWTRKDSAPTLRTSTGAVSAGFFFTLSRRRFLRCCSRARASGANSGATMTSLKISAIAWAHSRSSTPFTAMMPPKGACRSVAKAFSHAARKLGPCPMPHGFVCLRIASVGGSPANSPINAAAAGTLPAGGYAFSVFFTNTTSGAVFRRVFSFVVGISSPPVEKFEGLDDAADLDEKWIALLDRREPGVEVLRLAADVGERLRRGHCRAVAREIPLVGFYLQPAVGGRVLSYRFWRAFAEIGNVVAIKIAPFNRYRTLDVVRAVLRVRLS